MTRKLEAVVTDMDGTLLGPDWKIGEQDKKTFAALKAQGIPVFVATGRHQSICRWYFDELGKEYPAITSNGALLYDFATDTVLERHTIDHQDALAVQEFTQQNGLLYYLYTDTHCYLNPANAESETFQGDLRLCALARKDESGLMGPDFALRDHTIVKMMIPDCTNEYYARFLETPVGKKLNAAWSGNDFLDINPVNTNKGVAVCSLARRYGFSTENTLAMGDNFNDMEMLQTVGIPVVPASAPAPIQRLASLVTRPSGDNPLTYAVQQLFPALLGQ